MTSMTMYENKIFPKFPKFQEGRLKLTRKFETLEKMMREDDAAEGSYNPR